RLPADVSLGDLDASAPPWRVASVPFGWFVIGHYAAAAILPSAPIVFGSSLTIPIEIEAVAPRDGDQLGIVFSETLPAWPAVEDALFFGEADLSSPPRRRAIAAR